VRLTVNGQDRDVTADPDATLLDTLRDGLGLKGAKFGCGQGACGACVVLVDGRPTPSCETPMWSVAGRAVTTVEGIAARSHPLVAAFVAEQAAQCGYCIPGILVSAAALLAEDRHPDRAAVVAALDRHLCRCGAHGRIVRAVLRAARTMRAAEEPA
jgi:nicotinate dehydrogenase subunit A